MGFAGRLAMAGLAIVLLASCSSSGSNKRTTAAAEERYCFNNGQVANFAVVDRATVNMRAGTDGYFQIKLLDVCPQFDWRSPITLSTAGTSTVCTGYDLTILANTTRGVQECAAESLRRMSSSEVSALPQVYRP